MVKIAPFCAQIGRTQNEFYLSFFRAQMPVHATYYRARDRKTAFSAPSFCRCPSGLEHAYRLHAAAAQSQRYRSGDGYCAAFTVAVEIRIRYSWNALPRGTSTAFTRPPIDHSVFPITYFWIFFFFISPSPAKRKRRYGRRWGRPAAIFADSF